MDSVVEIDLSKLNRLQIVELLSEQVNLHARTDSPQALIELMSMLTELKRRERRNDVFAPFYNFEFGPSDNPQTVALLASQAESLADQIGEKVDDELRALLVWEFVSRSYILPS